MARRLKEQKRFQETEDLLRWAVDGLRTEIGEQKVAARQVFSMFFFFKMGEATVNGRFDGNFTVINSYVNSFVMVDHG